jgi:AraC-like DNA-binding protein
MKSWSWPLEAFPVVLRAGMVVLSDRNFSVKYYSKEYYALHIYDYEATIKLGNETFQIKPGTITFSPAGVKSSYNLSYPGYHIYIHFQKGNFNQENLEIPLCVQTEKEKDSLWLKFLEIINYHRISANNKTVQAIKGSALQELILSMNLFTAEKEKTTYNQPSTVQDAARLIEERMTSCLDVPALSRELGISQNYLARMFKKYFGMTMPRYQLVKRMELAHYLLTGTDMPVKAIANRVGMPDPQHFNKQFRLIMGKSPSSVR